MLHQCSHDPCWCDLRGEKLLWPWGRWDGCLRKSSVAAQASLALWAGRICATGAGKGAPKLPTAVLPQRGRSSTAVEPRPWEPLSPWSSLPEAAVPPPTPGPSAGSCPLPCPASPSLRDAWPFPCLSTGPGYRTSQKQHTFPTLLKTAKAVDAI